MYLLFRGLRCYKQEWATVMPKLHVKLKSMPRVETVNNLHFPIYYWGSSEYLLAEYAYPRTTWFANQVMH